MDERLDRLHPVAEGIEPRAALSAMTRAAAEACDRFGTLAEVVLSGQVGDSSGFTNLLENFFLRAITVRDAHPTTAPKKEP